MLGNYVAAGGGGRARARGPGGRGGPGAAGAGGAGPGGALALHDEVHEVLVVDVPLRVLLALQQLLHLGGGRGRCLTRTNYDRLS